MELAMQIISNDETVKSDTVQDLKKFNNQSLRKRAEKGEQSVYTMSAIKKHFDPMGDNRVDLSTENAAFKNNIGSYDQRWLEESRAKLLKQIDNEKRANLILSRMKKQKEKP